MNLKARLLGSWVGDALLRDLVVDDVRDVAPRFRWITLSGSSLCNAPFSVGDKVQVYLPGVGARTYSPFGFDGEAGRFELLAYMHGNAPGAHWARGLKRGSSVRIFGPRASLGLAEIAGPIALFGDETSVGLARALQESRRGLQTFMRIEVSDISAASDALRAVDLPTGCLVSRMPNRAHLPAIVGELLDDSTDRTLVLTGDAHAIQELRAQLRANDGRHVQKVRPYWATGKIGLD